MKLLLLAYLCCLTPENAVQAALRNGGHPKFPANDGGHTCTSRAVPWTPKRQSKIIGGEVPPMGAIPWVAELLHEGTHHCGGVLISSRLLLTVAHCKLSNLTVRVGTRSLDEFSPYEQNLGVERFVQHEDFRTDGPYSNDIALVLISKPGVQLNAFVRAACVPRETPPSGSWCEVSGWGASDPKNRAKISSVLQTASVPLVSSETCRKDGIYGGRLQPILDSMVCAGRLRGGIDACGGDSGGPLFCEHEGRLILTGLVSWGDGCAKKHRPGVYTRVSAFNEWIVTTATSLGVNIS